MKHPLVLNKIGVNLAWLIAGQLIYKLLSLVSLILIARHMNVKEFGIFSYALAYVGLFYALPDLGLSDLLVRETAKNKHIIKKFFANSLTLKIMLSFITFIVMIASSAFHSYDSRIGNLIFIFGVGIILESFNFLMKAVFQAHEQMRYEAYSLFSEGILRFLLVLWALNKGLGVIEVASIFFISTFFGLLISAYFVNSRFLSFRFQFDRKYIIRHFAVALPFAGLYLLGYINLKIDVVMALHILGDKATGLFGVANRLVEPLLILPIIFGICLAPSISNAIEWGRNEIKSFLRKSILFLGLAYSLFCATLMLTAPFFFKNIFGNSYLEATGTFCFLIWFLPLFGLQIICEKLLNGLRREWMTVGVYFAGTVINIVCNFWFMPKYGLIGAVASTLLAQSLVLIGLFSLIYFVPIKKQITATLEIEEELQGTCLKGYDA